MNTSNITVTVKLFAIYQEVYGVPEITLNFPEKVPVKTVLDEIVKIHPQLKKWQTITRFAINLNFVDPHTLIQNQDEIVLIPPVNGG
jgi:sulfur-carrier protein